MPLSWRSVAHVTQNHDMSHLLYKKCSVLEILYFSDKVSIKIRKLIENSILSNTHYRTTVPLPLLFICSQFSGVHGIFPFFLTTSRTYQEYILNAQICVYSLLFKLHFQYEKSVFCKIHFTLKFPMQLPVANSKLPDSSQIVTSMTPVHYGLRVAPLWNSLFSYAYLVPRKAHPCSSNGNITAKARESLDSHILFRYQGYTQEQN